jgi:20S proteasome alpha/beta subunit
MTCIAWDGKTLAADKRACNGTLYRTVTKIFRVGDSLMGYSGDPSFGEGMRAWIAGGEKPDDFPAFQRDKDDWVVTLVIRANGTIHKYERTPNPITFEDKHFAIGCGRDFALAAMHLGKTAREAVEVAIALDSGCGNGIDTLTLEGA